MKGLSDSVVAGWALALTCMVTAACDPAWAIVAENRSGEDLLARTTGFTGDEGPTGQTRPGRQPGPRS